MPNSGYNYASSKIRALEPSILDQTDIERMVDAPDFQTAFKVLNDTDYADNLLEVEPIEYRKALSDDYRQLYELLKDITPDPKLFRLIFLERDLVNIKLLFKAKYFDASVDEFLRDSTIYPVEAIKEFILNQKDIGLDREIKNLITEAQKQIGENSRPDVIDYILTKEYFALIQKIAQQINSPLINDLVKIQINNANVLTWIRSKRLNLDKNKLAEKLIPDLPRAESRGSGIYTKKLVELYSDEAKSLRPLISVHYDKQTTESFDNYCEKDLLFEFEKALEDFKTRKAQKAQMIAAGPEVIYAYHLAKRNAVANIRIIMTGKFNKISGEEIKKTLRLVR